MMNDLSTILIVRKNATDREVLLKIGVAMMDWWMDGWVRIRPLIGGQLSELFY